MIVIAGISIAPVAGFEVRQTLDPIEAKTILRTLNGTGIQQSRWKKLQSTITGAGWLPDGLDALNTDNAVAVSCIEPLSVASASNIITIPRACRSDSPYAPQGAAIVDGQLVQTPLTLAGSVATLMAVAGATQYHVVYYPVITGFVTVRRSFDDARQVHNWTIEVVEQ